MLAPGKQLQLIEKAGRKAARLEIYAANAAADPKTPPCIDPLPQDRRFNDEGWRGWPYNLIYHWFRYISKQLEPEPEPRWGNLAGPRSGSGTFSSFGRIENPPYPYTFRKAN